MEITYRDFLDKPYVEGWQHCKKIFKASSCNQVISCVALTILLWTPLANIGIYLILKNVKPINSKKPQEKEKVVSTPTPTPATLVSKLAAPLIPMSAAEKASYGTHTEGFPNKVGKVNLPARKASFGTNFERVALMKVTTRKETSQLFDLRIVDKDPTHGTTLYCPFHIGLTKKNTTYILDSATGWLKISQCPVEQYIFINRIDNFAAGYSQVRLGSALVQFAIEMSLKAGYEGKVKVRSTNGSAGFYHRLGFVCENPEHQKKVEEEYRTNQRGLDGGDMYLPPEAIEVWKTKIAQASILG